MTYLEVTEFLFRQLPMYQRQGISAFKKNLDNIIALCKVLGDPQEQFKSIHIAGTNGKGSTSHMMAAGLQANGYRVGLYTSPHYKDYRERIKINAEFISEKEVISFVTSHKEDFLKIQPSFFEITVAMAFSHFAKHNVDVAIIETGLGGRLDSTNIISPILSIITNISFDHQSMLGDTLEQIAGEKAGIIKPQVPVIIGEYQKEINSVFIDKATENKSLIYQADQSSELRMIEQDKYHYKINNEDWSVIIKTNLTNVYQQKNLTTALYALWHLKAEFDLDSHKISAGIEHINRLTYYIGRWMIIKEDPLTIFDSAHNEAGLHYLFDEIGRMEYGKLHVVYGTASDKDLDKILPLLPTDAIYYLAKADIPRGMKTDMLAEQTKKYNLYGLEYTSVATAYRNAVTCANPGDIIVVTGSIFVVAEVL